MWKLHRYYFREVMTGSLLTFTVLFGIVLISVIYRGISRAQGFGIWAMAKTTMFMAADTIPHLLAIALLFATVMCFARASQDREITAIRSAGISPRVALTSALLVGVLFSLVASYAFHYVVPWAHFNKYRVVAEELRQVILNTGMGDDHISLNDGIIFTWEMEPFPGQFEDVYIHIPRAQSGGEAGFSQFGQIGLLRSRSASLKPVGEQLILTTNDVFDPISGAQYGDITLSLNLRDIIEDRGPRREGDRDLTSDQLLAEVNLGIHPDPQSAVYTVHRRGCFALMPFLFAPLGFCIGVFARERGRIFALVLSMIPLIVFYVTDILGAKVVVAFDQPVLGWLPAIVVTVLGAPFCWRLLRF